MQIVANEEQLRHYLRTAVEIDEDKPVLVDKYIEGREVEIDAICDGRNVFVPGIMELVERTGVHSGDSVSVYPPFSISNKVKGIILQYAKKLGLGIGIVGLFNIQFIVDQDDNVFIIEVNPRSSRTVPFLSKATGYSLADIATEVILGKSLKEQGFFDIYPEEKENRCYVKAPVFSFNKIRGLACNQFGGQSPESDAETTAFCQLNYGTEFPQMKKSEVNGANELPLYKWLKAEHGFKGFDKGHHLSEILDTKLREADADYDKKSDIKWNFTKFLINRQGEVVARFEPTADMAKVEEVIEKLL